MLLDFIKKISDEVSNFNLHDNFLYIKLIDMWF